MKNDFKNGELNARAECAMLGMVVQAFKKESLEYMLGYIARTLGCEEATGAEIYAKATEFIDPTKTEAVNLSCSTIYGTDRVANIVFRDKDKPFVLDDPDGVLCYTYNFTYPDCSELGYCYFEKKGLSDYHRIG